MSFWSVILLGAVLTGVMGWTLTPLINGILWYCDWKDGVSVPWGLEVAFTIAVPFAWFFALIELFILYRCN
ncbi:MAG TPA: hypothetical protein V6C86_25345 [Oculatellaceae cyanobacterium]